MRATKWLIFCSLFSILSHRRPPGSFALAGIAHLSPRPGAGQRVYRACSLQEASDRCTFPACLCSPPAAVSSRSTGLSVPCVRERAGVCRRDEDLSYYYLNAGFLPSACISFSARAARSCLLHARALVLPLCSSFRGSGTCGRRHIDQSAWKSLLLMIRYAVVYPTRDALGTAGTEVRPLGETATRIPDGPCVFI